MKRIYIANKKANFNYEIEEKISAGIVLQGSEVKSIRLGKVNISDSYASVEGNEIFLINSLIEQYDKAKNFGHASNRHRKLLLQKKEIRKLIGKIKIKGYSVVPMALYENDRGVFKIEIGIGKGKKNHDKRQDIKRKDWERQKARIKKGVV